MLQVRLTLFALATMACSVLPAAGQDQLCASMKEVVAKLAAKDLTTLRGPYLEDGVANKIYQALMVLPGFRECEFVESGPDRALSCSISERTESAAQARVKALQSAVLKCFPQAKTDNFSPGLYANRLPEDVTIEVTDTVGPVVFFSISRVWRD